MKKNVSGYLFGFFFSGVAAVLIIAFAAFYLPYRYAGCAINLGCEDDNSGTYLLLALLGAYLLIAASLAAFARRVFHTRPIVGFLVNVLPLAAIITLLFLRMNYRDYARRRDRTRAIQTAIREAPAIHLGQPYVKKVDRESGPIILLHVPFVVDRIVQSRSLNILVTSRRPSSGVKYSSKPECNDAATEPSNGFHIVDREFTEPPLPVYEPGTKIIRGQLKPGVQYYLLQELHFSSACRVSDYDDFDPKQFTVAVDLVAAEDGLEDR
jgi:hypothetical protein